ncbi:MAG: GNAT family N-acetyltransferase [Lachnospiraceae bacterium]
MLLVDGIPAGIAFGWARQLDVPEDCSFTLDGIAVKEQYRRRGLGSLLLKKFESCASGYGFNRIGVGSAEGCAEEFYIRNGYAPKEYKVFGE